MLTKTFVANGAARVYILGRRRHVLEAVAQDLGPEVVVPIVADVVDKDALIRAAEVVREDIGWVNLVCCNSGRMVGMSAPLPLPTTSSGRKKQS